jgi:hypothetical protein
MDDDIVDEEGTFFRHAILSWLEFSFKVHMNYMARTHYQIQDERLLLGLLPDLRCNPIPFAMGKEATDEVEAKKLLRNTVPFINPTADFCEGAYSMVLLQSHTHVFRLAQAVFKFMSKTERPWQCRLCLHLFVVAMQAAGMMNPTPVPPADLREGPNFAATLWIDKTCGKSKSHLCERWLDPHILTDLPRDLERFPVTKEERIIQRRASHSSPFTYIPLTRKTQPNSKSVSSDDEIST